MTLPSASVNSCALVPELNTCCHPGFSAGFSTRLSSLIFSGTIKYRDASATTSNEAAIPTGFQKINFRILPFWICASRDDQYRFSSSASESFSGVASTTFPISAYHASIMFFSSGVARLCRYFLRIPRKCFRSIIVSQVTHFFFQTTIRFFLSFFHTNKFAIVFLTLRFGSSTLVGKVVKPLLELSNLTDHELLNAISQDDEKAFAELFRRYWKQVHAMAYARVKSKEVTEEIVQDLFASLWDKRAT